MTGQRSRRTSLPDAFSRLGQIRLDETPLGEVLDLVARLTVEVVPGATGASLTIPGTNSKAKRDTVVTASHPQFAELEWTPGPSARAALKNGQVHANGAFGQWPQFGHAAVRLGVLDVVASPLALADDRRGGLSVYSRESRFDPQAVMAADVLACHVSATVANALAFDRLVRVEEQLTEGLRSRETIGLAKGILMRQEGCSEADAFRILVRSSQRLDQKVRDVARQVVALTEGRSDVRQGGNG